MLPTRDDGTFEAASSVRDPAVRVLRHEVTGKLLRRGVAIHEVPIRYRPRSIEEGKKIKWTDGAIALWTLLKHRLRA